MKDYLEIVIGLGAIALLYAVGVLVSVGIPILLIVWAINQFTS